MLRAALGDGGEQPRFTERLAVGVLGLDQSVGAEAQQVVARGPGNLAALDRGRGGEAERRRRGDESLGDAGCGNPPGIRMPRVGIGQPARLGVEHAVEHGEVHLGGRELGRDAVEQRDQRLVRRE